MSTIKEHLDKILDETKELHTHAQKEFGNECAAINAIELAAHEARQAFDQRVNLDNRQ